MNGKTLGLKEKLDSGDFRWIFSGRILPQFICLPYGFMYPSPPPELSDQGRDRYLKKEAIVQHTAIQEAFRDPLLSIVELSLSEKTIVIQWMKSLDNEIAVLQALRFLRFGTWIRDFIMDPGTKDNKTAVILERLQRQDPSNDGYNALDVYGAGLGIEFLGHGIVFLEGVSPLVWDQDNLTIKFQFLDAHLVSTDN